MGASHRPANKVFFTEDNYGQERLTIECNMQGINSLSHLVDILVTRYFSPSGPVVPMSRETTDMLGLGSGQTSEARNERTVLLEVTSSDSPSLPDTPA